MGFKASASRTAQPPEPIPEPGEFLVTPEGTDLCWAAFSGDLPAVRELLAHAVDVDSRDMEGRSVLHNAAAGDEPNLEIVRTLLGAGANIRARDTVGFTALHFAAQQGHSEVAELLLARGADIEAEDAWGNTALWRACSAPGARKRRIIHALLAAGANPNHANQRGVSARHVAPELFNN